MDGKKTDSALNLPEGVSAINATPAGPRITFLVSVYNEAARIESVLAHAVRWADEVIVVNKSSTDRTEEIAQGYDPKIWVLTVPFSPQGQDRPDEWIKRARHDWIFCGTCSEMPTRRLISEVRKLLSRSGDSLDLVLVPRRMYSLGVHHPSSPWSVSYYPFLLHRHRAIITNVIHEHFKAADPARVATIPYSEDCCVHHLTHPSARRFLEVHAEYAQIEAGVERDPDRAILGWLKNIHRGLPGIMRTGEDWPGIFSAWAIYNLMNVLLTWEKARGLDVPAYYQQLRARLLAEEWGVAAESVLPGDKSQAAPGGTATTITSASIGPELKQSVCVAYWAANILYHWRHPKAILRSLRAWAAGQKARLLRKLRSQR